MDHFISFGKRYRLIIQFSKATTAKLTFILSHTLSSYHLPFQWHATFTCAPGVLDQIKISTGEVFLYNETCKSIFNSHMQYFNWSRFKKNLVFLIIQNYVQSKYIFLCSFLEWFLFRNISMTHCTLLKEEDVLKPDRILLV